MGASDKRDLTAISSRASDARCYPHGPDGYLIEAGQAGKKTFDLVEDFGG